MDTPRQARQGSALLSMIVCVAISATAMSLPVQADEPVKAGEGEKDRGLDAAGIQGQADSSPLIDPATRQSLNEYLVRDRAVAIHLANAERAIAEERGGAALADLQAVLDASSDVFIWPESGGSPVSARATAANLFRQLPADVLAEYERLHGGDARRLLAEFDKSFEAEAQRELLRRYEFTAAGAQALRIAAHRALDCGEFVGAARQFEQYLEHPLAEPIDPADRRRAAVAADLGANQAANLAGIVEHDWRLALGNEQAHRQCAGTLPTLNPLWSAPHDELTAANPGPFQTVSFEDAPQGSELLASWLQTRHERHLPCAGANFAIVDRGHVLIRDFSGITARGLRSGAILWQYPCVSGLVRRAAEVQAVAKASSTPEVPLAAAQLFNELFAQNSVLGMLASDGKRVYAIDLCATDPESDAQSVPEAWNRLIALSLEVEGREPGDLIWETSANGLCFLGPPLPVGDRLYVVAERDSLVSLLALEATTGRPVWEQPISLVDAAIGDDPQRARQACVPSLSGGIIVCPTQLGTVVGVDARSGGLLWVYAYAETTGPSQPWRKARSFDREYGMPEFPNLPVIVGQTVIVLAPQSDFVHAIELQSGRCVWKKGRENAQYVATAADDLVLLVGPKTCTARRISSGEEVWRQTIDAPTGRGLVVGDAFLVPVSGGRVLSLDLRTGTIAPDLLPRLERTRSVALRPGDGTILEPPEPEDAPTPLGNLIGSGEYIVTCSPTGVAVYPQAGAALESIRESDRTQPLSNAAWLERGELELRLGDGAAAEDSLWHALEGNPTSRTRIAAEFRLRELLYAELGHGADTAKRLADLDRLCVLPDQRARFLVERLKYELQGDDVAAALRTAAEIDFLGDGVPTGMDARGAYVAEPTRVAATMLVRHARLHPTAWQPQPTAPASLANVAEGSFSERLRTLRTVRVRELIESRQFQAAELLLLADTRQTEHAVRRTAAVRLAELWRERGLTRDSQRLLGEYEAHIGREHGNATGQEFTRVEIEQRLCSDDTALAAFVSQTLAPLFPKNREYTRQPAGSRVLFDRGFQGTSVRFTSLSVVDMSGPTTVADLEPLPPRAWRAGDLVNYDAGHFLPIAGFGDVHGVSLLEGRITWSTNPATHRMGDKPLLGPFGPEYCILQSQETVTALDPHDGHVLWRRTDIPFDAGLEKGDSCGMFADDLALVIFDADHVTYRLLDPRSGELLGTGKLEPAAELRRRGWAFGRRLLFLSQESPPRLKLWDPLQDVFDFNIPIAGRCLVDTGLGSGLATILNGGRLLILDTQRGEVIWETMLSPGEAAAARQIRSCRERDRFLIHIEQDVPNSTSSQATHDISSVPNLPLSGTLFVIDRTTGSHWHRPMPRCNLLLFPIDRVPALITLGRTREGADQGPAFVLEVIDGKSGDTLARTEELLRTNKVLVHTRFDPERNIVELLGDESRIDVRFMHEADVSGTGE